MVELSATALMGIVIAAFYFSLATATLTQANKAKPKDMPNIIFGSLFLLFAVLIAIMAGRAVFMV
jgi:phosphotransferase system  glucose/maltose/N-acetylglucosamine-specific IIC component